MIHRTLCLALLLVSPLALRAQTTHLVEALPNNTFSPRNITIQAGDSIRFVNRGGLHNVESSDPDGSFRCADGCDDTGGNGAASGAAWEAIRVFPNPGEIDYVCVVHENQGMRGTIVVQPAAGGDPGEIRFPTTSFSAGEGDGSVAVAVQRRNGSSGAVSVRLSTENGSAVAGSDYTSTVSTVEFADGEDGTKTVDVAIEDDSEQESAETFTTMLDQVAGGATLGTSSATVTIVDNDSTGGPRRGRLRFTSDRYDTSEGNGSVEVAVERVNGAEGAVGATVQSSDGSAQSGTDYEPLTADLQWADGDSGQRTATITLVDDGTLENEETINLALSNPSGGVDLTSPSSATVVVADDDLDLPPCVADDKTLCLNKNGRFQIELTYTTPNGQSGAASAVDIGKRDSGLFYIFDENNIEMLVKVLDACALTGFNAYWVFYAATTDVAFELTVSDTEADVIKAYSNPQGMAADPVTDTQAFSTCP